MDNHNTTIGIFDAGGCLSERGLTLYAEGRLHDMLLQQASQHLAECELCSTALEGWEMMLLQRSQPELEALVGSIHAGIDEKVIEAKAKQSRARTFRTGWIAAAASLVILLGFYFVLRNDNKPATAEIAQQLSKPDETVHANLDTFIPAEKPEHYDKFVPPVVVTDNQIEESLLSEELSVSVNSIDSKAEDIVVEDKIAENVAQNAENKSLMMVDDPKAVKKEKNVMGYAAPATKQAGNPGQNGREAVASSVFTVVEEMPEFPGGQDSLIRFISRNLRYPQTAKESGIQGTVWVVCVIDSRGRVKDPTIGRGIGGGCDEEALRVFRMMPDWLPGRQAGKPVDVRFTMPVKFSLQ